MIWPVVAREYMRTFQRACQHRYARPSMAFPAMTLAERERELPPLNLGHLRRLTDDVGILQHAVATVPNYNEGYTTDDNARALMLMVCLEEFGKERMAQTKELAARYMAFLWHAHNPQNGHFRNFMAYDRRWLEERFARQPCAGAMGIGNGVGTLATGGTAARGQPALRAGAAGRARVYRPAADGFRIDRAARLLAAFFRRSCGTQGAGVAGRSFVRGVPAIFVARLAVV